MQMKIRLPDYGNCIANLPNSILSWFSIDPGRPTLPLLDDLLERSPRVQNVVLLLLDGMGSCILEENLRPEGFFRSHLCGSYLSTFPPTTVAATTSILSGMDPCEHGWLGWDCFFPEIGKNVTVFRNTETGTEKPAAAFHVAETCRGYESVISRIRKEGREAFFLSPFADPPLTNLPDLLGAIIDVTERPGKKYVYAYWPEPDSTMHRTGCYSRASREVLRTLEISVENLCRSLPKGTLLLLTADHGHLNTEGIALEDFPEIEACLKLAPSIEARALSCFVHPGMERDFEKAFSDAFGDQYLLLPREEVIARKLFGSGPEHAMFRASLGDYLCLAFGLKAVYASKKEAEHFIGAHAGLTENEMVIPLLALEI